MTFALFFLLRLVRSLIGERTRAGSENEWLPASRTRLARRGRRERIPLVRMNLERWVRRLEEVLSVGVMAVGVAADALLSPSPPWKVSLALRDGRKAILRLTWTSSYAHDRAAVAAELTRLMRCPAGRGSELDCLSFKQEALLLPQSVAGPIAMAKSWVRGPDGVIFSVIHAHGASREEIIAKAQKQYRPSVKT